MEKKASTLKQTAAKIKTKIHNTSSFFKVSLKSNNKALALALVAEKQKSRQLEMEMVRLQKELQNVNFDLAIQRHKNKQMFAILREFYNTSITCMAKAVDLISKEEGAESSNTELFKENILGALLPEQKNRTSKSNYGQQKDSQGSGGTVSMVTDLQPQISSSKSKDKPPSPEVDHTAPQNTLYDSAMEITVVDSAAKIVTVQTKKCKDDQGETKKNNAPCSPRSRERIVLNSNKAALVPPCLKDVIADTSMRTSCETQLQTSPHTLTSRNKEEGLPQWVEPWDEEEAVKARRKIHVTSRNTKRNRQLNSQSNTAGNGYTRKPYVISSHESTFISTNDRNLDDYFNDQEAQSQERNMGVSHDVSKENEAEILKSQNSINSKKTFTHKSKPQRRMTKVFSFAMDQNEKESIGLTDVHVDVPEISVHSEKYQSKQSARSHSQTDEGNMLRNRGTCVIQTGQSSACTDLLSHTVDNHTHVASEESVNAVMESTHEAQCTSRTTDWQQLEQEVPHITENRSFFKHFRTVCDDHLDNSPVEQSKSKKPKIIAINKSKNSRNNVSGKRRFKCSPIQTGHIFPKVISLPGDDLNDSAPANVPRILTEGFNSSAPEEPVIETADTNRTHVRLLNRNDVLNNVVDRGRNLKDVSPKSHGVQSQKSKCRETRIVWSNCDSQLKKNENAVFFSRNKESSIANRESGISFAAEKTFVPPEGHDLKPNTRTADQLKQKHSEVFAEERPPWEALDFGSTGSFISDSPVNNQKDTEEISSRTMTIYEEPGCNVTHQSPGIQGRAMKSLTNTDLTADPLVRSRRKAAPVSYKEPNINSKMRRGDKFSDTRFLHSPVFKEKNKTFRKKHKVNPQDYSE